MDEFEAAGFDEETCEILRKASEETGLSPQVFIDTIRSGGQPLAWLELREAAYDFKQALKDTPPISWMYRLAEWLCEKLSRKDGAENGECKTD